MTQERFFQLIDDPELLRRITYEELKTLALAYPYAHNLRYLLALKARQIEHPEASLNLATAAAYSLDRTKLFTLVAPQVIVLRQVMAPEEVLELKPIETVKRELAALVPQLREEKPLESPDNLEADPSRVHIPETSIEVELVPSNSAEIEVSDLPDMDEVPGTDAEMETVTASPGEAAEENPATSHQSFSDWIACFQPLPLSLSAVPATRPLEEKSEIADETEEASRKITGIAQQLAERSVAENRDVISETLAKLYAKQGYRDKSAQMYTRLALLFPEKSAYFAAEIDKLKK